MISTSSSIQGVQSMKNLQQFSLANNFKKHDFLSPTSKQPLNDVKCPEDKPRFELPTAKAEQIAPSAFNMPTSPNF